MADKKKSLSLNDRHNHRLLQSSSSPSKAPSNPPGEEEEEESKPQKVKVKLQGRRRLCKLSSREDDDDETGGGFLNEPKFSGITDDPESPPSRIRDIVDDLSSKLHFLSIEKPKRVGGGKATLAEDLSSSTTSSHHPHPPLCVINEEGPKQKQQHQVQKGNVNVDVNLDYASADSSFSVSPDSPCRSSLDKAPLHSSVDFEKNADNEHKKKNSPKMDTKDRSIVSGNLDEDDDCLVLSNSAAKKVREKAPTRASCLVKEKEEEEEEEEVTNFISVDDYDDDDVLGDSITTSDSSVSMDDGDTFILSGKPSNYKLPGKIAKMLFPHQQDGLKWLWSLHCRGTGGILGDDMGLGKTMQICSFLAGLFHSCLIKRALVVAPKTLLAHWVKELSIVGLSEKTREYYAASVKIRQYELQYILQHSGILLTTYDIVRNNSKSLRCDCDYDDDGEESIIWDYIILDEGHIIKNPSTQRAKSLLEMPSSHRIIISGTPIQNNLKELWALFSFCCPELLGDTKEFKARYESAILRGNEKNATDREKRIGSTVAKELRERIEPYFLRRMKSEVSLENEATKSGKLSEKNEIIVWLRLTHCQRQLYEAFLKSELVLSSFDGSPLAAITVLKKICDHPLLLTKRAAEDVLDEIDPPLNQDGIGVVERMVSQLANASDSEDSEKMNHNISCKISFIISLLDNLIPEGHNVLIFSQTRKMLNLVQEAIILKGYKFLRIDGTTKASDRAKIVNDFQEGDKAPIFLLTSQVGGLGLTLTKADRVIVVDPAWNPSTDNQSVDRAYRIGQKKDVIVYRLMTCGTIEEKIYKMQVFKGGLLKTATEHKEQTRYFSQQDLRELFSLPKQGFDVSLTQQQLHEEHDYQQIMNNSLKNHIMFLKSQGIAGVSNHSLLFSKTPPLQEDDELLRGKETSFVGTSSSSSSLERDIDKPEYAFNPKDVKLLRKNAAGVVRGQPTESEIKDRIKRLHDTLADKGIISKLPDKGRKIEQQIFDLNLELDKFKMAESSKKEVINIDELSDELQRVSV